MGIEARGGVGVISGVISTDVIGVAEWCDEAIAGTPEESFMAFRNHTAIQQRSGKKIIKLLRTA
jgi:hypothetical protein